MGNYKDDESNTFDIAAFVCLLGVIFSLPVRNLVKLPVGPFSIGTVIGLITAVFWGMKLLTSKKVRGPNVFHLSYIFFFSYITLSLLWTKDVSRSLNVWATYLMIGIVLFIMLDLTRNKFRLEIILISYVLGSASLLLLLLYNILLGMATASSRFSVFALNPNAVAAHLVYGVAIAIYLYLTRKSPLRRHFSMRYWDYFFLVFALVASAAVIFTGSRQNFIILLFIYAYTFLYILFQNRKDTRILILGGFGGISGIALTINRFGERFMKIPHVVFNKELRRFDLWEASWDAFLQKPIMGHGVGTTRLVIEYVLGRPQATHQTILEILSSTGIVGFLIFSFMISFPIRLIPQTREYKHLWIVLSFTLFIRAMVNNIESNVFPFLILMLICLSWTFVNKSRGPSQC